MALSLSSVVTVKAEWNQTDTQQSNSRYSDIGSVNYATGLNSTNSQINLIHHDIRTIPSGQQSEILDLFALSRSLFSGTNTVNFSGAGIKTIAIENISSGVGRDLTIRNTGLAGFGEPFGYSTGFPVPALSPEIRHNHLSSWSVHTGARYLNINNQNTGQTLGYEILILGYR